MMFRVFRGSFTLFVFLMAFCAPRVTFSQANGIYADFNTSMGSFTCALYYATAPKAVANFIGLATGEKSWLDFNTGTVRTNPFYNGLIFHRVISNFVIQAGSPNGLGTDGPGYVFTDEITPALRFANPGVLAMANNGTNSNSAQFFLTATNRPDLNDGYTIFGQLIGGTNVLLAINHVATDASEKPLTNVYLQSVNIRRVGSAAQAFDIRAQGLPTVTNVNLKIARATGGITLTFSNRLYTHNRIFQSTNLVNWSVSDLGVEVSGPVTNTVYGSSSGKMAFFKGVQTQYPSNPFAPPDVFGKKLVLTFSSVHSGSITNNFDNAGSGTYTYGTNNGVVTFYDWSQQPYRGILFIVYPTDFYPLSLKINFTGTNGGTFSGFEYPFYPSSIFGAPVTGTFTLN